MTHQSKYPEPLTQQRPTRSIDPITLHHSQLTSSGCGTRDLDLECHCVALPCTKDRLVVLIQDPDRIEDSCYLVLVLVLPCLSMRRASQRNMYCDPHCYVEASQLVFLIHRLAGSLHKECYGVDGVLLRDFEAISSVPCSMRTVTHCANRINKRQRLLDSNVKNKCFNKPKKKNISIVIIIKNQRFWFVIRS